MMDSHYNDVSGKVGYKKGIGPEFDEYPKNLNAVKKASDYQIIRWYRFLPAPKTHYQSVLIRAISLEASRIKADSRNK
jgi:hypothetical protein